MNYAVLELEKEIREKRKELARDFLIKSNINATQVCENDLLEIYAALKVKAKMSMARTLNDVEQTIKKED